MTQGLYEVLTLIYACSSTNDLYTKTIIPGTLVLVLSCEKLSRGKGASTKKVTILYKRCVLEFVTYSPAHYLEKIV